ncbi:hypothetical protein QBC35DRAFT_522555 [Podospora australis]|uniref:Uncharacterized protein n=1 Tax=Podospora australis TaxID=1536484 RepID=A0AAN6WZJ3_9PEZI|nr:hypothetical protein QBC35DRAFT_522555 [Podospora australis]
MFRPLTAILLVLSHFIPASVAGRSRKESFPAQEIFSFPPSNPVFIENLLPLPDNRILLSHFGAPGPDTAIYVLNSTTYPASVSIVGWLPNSTSQTGIAALGENHYAITAGIVGTNFEFIKGTGAVYVIELKNGENKAKVVDRVPVPNTINLNGLVAIPPLRGKHSKGKRSHILLSADSRGGRVFRIDLKARTAKVELTDAKLGGDPSNPEAGSIAITGVNGLALRKGQGRFDGWLYFANSAQGIVGRIKVDERGYQVVGKKGKVEVLGWITGRVTLGNFFDDMDVDEQENVYVGWVTERVLKIGKGTGKQTIVLGPEVVNRTVEVRYPTAVKVGLNGKKKEIFVAGGGIGGDGTMLGGQVIRVGI